MNLRPAVLALALALFPSLAVAGGSIAWADVEPVLSRNATLRKVIKGQLTVAETGSAVRLGRQFEHLGGLRVAPYEFTAKTADGAALYLTIECDQQFILADGTVAGDDDDITRAVKVVETPTRISLSTVAPADGN